MAGEKIKRPKRKEKEEKSKEHFVICENSTRLLVRMEESVNAVLASSHDHIRIGTKL